MDNKYANLPGIARNEPDCYETTNVIINDRLEPSEDDSINVHRINVNLNEVHDKFNFKTLNSEYTDFSDTITNRRKVGYRVESDAYELSYDMVETPIQRFKRLEKELKELKEDINEINQSESPDSAAKLLNYNPVELSQQVELLQKQINSLYLESIGAKVDVSKTETKVKKQLLIDHLNESKKYLNSAKDASNKQASTESSIVFKLFKDLEAEDLAKANKISELNERIANLEKAFGAGSTSFDERQLNVLCSNVENKSIMGLVENLNSKMSLLDNSALEQVEHRLQIVNQRLTQLNEKKNLFEDQEKLNRINELYQMVVKWKDASSSVPSIVERLAALNDLHQKAFQFPAILNRLDTEQQSIDKKLTTSSDLLVQLKQNFESNLNSINKNFEVLMSRIDPKQ